MRRVSFRSPLACGVRACRFGCSPPRRGTASSEWSLPGCHTGWGYRPNVGIRAAAWGSVAGWPEGGSRTRLSVQCILYKIAYVKKNQRDNNYNKTAERSWPRIGVTPGPKKNTLLCQSRVRMTHQWSPHMAGPGLPGPRLADDDQQLVVRDGRQQLLREGRVVSPR